MEIVCVSLIIVILAIAMAAVAILWSKKPKGNDKCMNCGKAVPVNGLCPMCHYNGLTEKLES